MSRRRMGKGYQDRLRLIEEHKKAFSDHYLSAQWELAYYDLCQMARHTRVMRGWMSKLLEASDA